MSLNHNPSSNFIKQKSGYSLNSKTSNSHIQNQTSNKKNKQANKLNEEMFREKLANGSIFEFMSSKNKNKLNRITNKTNNHLNTSPRNNISINNNFQPDLLSPKSNSNGYNSSFFQTKSDFNKTVTGFSFFNSKKTNSNSSTKYNSTFHTNKGDKSVLSKNYKDKILLNADYKETTCSDISVLPTLQNYDVNSKMCILKDNYDKLKTHPDILDQDIETLKDCYYTYKNTEINNLKITESERKDVFERYNVDLSTLPLQENILKNYLNKIKLKNKLSSNDDNKDRNFSLNTHFDNIYTAVKSINTNKQIHDSITGIWSQKQIEKYFDIIGKEEELRYKLALMPIIRESRVEKNDKRRRLDDYQEDGGDYTQTNNLTNNLNKNISNNTNIEKLGRDNIQMTRTFLSRDIILQKELVFNIENIKYKKNRPSCRSHASFINVNGLIYLFGGVNGNRFNDVWTFEVKDRK